MPRRLTRDTRNAVLGGVAAGFGDYFDVDPVLVRLAFICLVFLHGIGALFYVICWVVMPARPQADGAPGDREAPAPAADRVVEQVREAAEKVVGDLRRPTQLPGRGRRVAGAILILLGSLFLLDRLAWLYWPRWIRFADLWPIVLIAIGVAMILRAGRGRPA